MDKQEYISKEAVIKIIKDNPYIELDAEGAIVPAIRRLPAADVAPVVRCKDCRFYELKQSYACELHYRAANADDYCSYGVRKAAESEETP